MKCSGSNPCQSCKRHGLECVFEGVIKRKNYPEMQVLGKRRVFTASDSLSSYIAQLVEKVAEQAKQLEEYQRLLSKEARLPRGRDQLPSPFEDQPLPASQDNSSTRIRASPAGFPSQAPVASTVSDFAKESGTSPFI